MPKINNKFYLRYFWNPGVLLRLWILDTNTDAWTRTETTWMTGMPMPSGLPRSRFFIRKYWFPEGMNMPIGASTGGGHVQV